MTAPYPLPNDRLEAMKSPEASAAYIQSLAQNLILIAEDMGVSLHITRLPLHPLAMGHARHVAETWPARRQSERGRQ